MPFLEIERHQRAEHSSILELRKGSFSEARRLTIPFAVPLVITLVGGSILFALLVSWTEYILIGFLAAFLVLALAIIWISERRAQAPLERYYAALNEELRICRYCGRGMKTREMRNHVIEDHPGEHRLERLKGFVLLAVVIIFVVVAFMFF
jgi:hypothetical protein